MVRGKAVGGGGDGVDNVAALVGYQVIEPVAAGGVAVDDDVIDGGSLLGVEVPPRGPAGR